ncbi:hypothetical protein D910_11181 [Dendroctonus ponderosae]|uniref:Uncharacterized protein n=1 Tax=Dendroctonus ponderosae TaxID=77166 RepID=U4UUR3_DENPD|nr:hypothetical protein D910_11181 [Dendroctonus ponderosae]
MLGIVFTCIRHRSGKSQASKWAKTDFGNCN